MRAEIASRRTIGQDRQPAQIRTGERPRFNADQTNGIAAEVSIPDDCRFRRSHARPALEWSMVLIDDRHHHLANVEGFLPPAIRLVGENLSHDRKAVRVAVAVRIDLHVPIERVGSLRPPRKPLA